MRIAPIAMAYVASIVLALIDGRAFAEGSADGVPQLASPEETALCSALLLANSGSEISVSIMGLAKERLDDSVKKAEECAIKPECQRSKSKQNLDAALREANNQHDKAKEMMRVLEQRRMELRERLVVLGGM